MKNLLTNWRNQPAEHDSKNLFSLHVYTYFFIVNNHKFILTTLIKSGASHKFINSNIVKKIGWKTNPTGDNANSDCMTFISYNVTNPIKFTQIILLQWTLHRKFKSLTPSNPWNVLVTKIRNIHRVFFKL